jgi:hypothetical protein
VHDVGFRIHQAALELLAQTNGAQEVLRDMDLASVAELLEGGAAAAALIVQLSCQLQLELGFISDDLGPDPPALHHDS